MSANYKDTYSPISEIASSVFQEHIDNKALKILIENYQEIEAQITQSRLIEISKKNKELYGNGYNLLTSLKKLSKNMNETRINNITYTHSKHLKTLGRLFADNPSLQSLPREIRGVLAKSKYLDIDMKNAHFNIAFQYCLKNKISCPHLTNYAKNRDDIINELKNKYSHYDIDYKHLFLAILNGAEREGIQDEFINDLKMEIGNIHNIIFEIKKNKDLKKSIERRKLDGYNLKGSLFNVILCDIENSILLNSVSFLKSKGFNIDVLIFDGFMVRIEDNKDLSNDLLKSLSDYIFEITEYKIEYLIKPLDNTINIDKYMLKYADDYIDDKITYSKDKSTFEENHIKIIHPPLYLTLKETEVIIQSEGEIIQSYKHLKTTQQKNINNKETLIKTSFIKEWVNDENIRRRDIITFTPPPLTPPPNSYNTWRDFEFDKMPNPSNTNDDEIINRFVDYVDNLLGNRKEYTNYFISWVANIIQTPAKRSQVCLILYSIEEGSGKSMICELIAKLLGEDKSYFITDLENQLFGKHSLAEMNRLFIVLNEIKGKDTYLNHDKFKSRITDPKRDYEPKGLKSFNGDNYCSYIATTNNPNCIPLHDKQRRFCPITCNNPKITDKIYFDKFRKEIVENVEAQKIIFEYLKQFNIDEYIPNKLFQEHIPTNDPLYENLMAYNKPVELEFLEDYLNKDMDFNNPDIKEMKTTKTDLFQEYKEFMTRLEDKKNSDITFKKFNLNLVEKVINPINKKAGFNDAIKYSTDKNPIRKRNEHAYHFNLVLLRKYFMYIKDD